jgi:hypothetical protein
MSIQCRRALRLVCVSLVIVIVMASPLMATAPACGANDPHADVVALAQPFTLNRMGAWVPSGMIYALKSDVIRDDGTSEPPQAGHAQLRPGRRPRPLVLRVNLHQCLTVTLWNMLPPPLAPPATVTANGESSVPLYYPATRTVGLHVNGLELAGPAATDINNDGSCVCKNATSLVESAATGINNDGSYVGKNATSLVEPDQCRKYVLYAAQEGTFLMYSMGANFDQQGAGATMMAQATAGIFGSVSVEPPGAEYYRSQVTRKDLLNYAIKRDGSGNPVFAPNGDPEINYQARYPVCHPRQCIPVLRMVAQAATVEGGQCVPSGSPQTFYGDLTAIITGPDTGSFPGHSPSLDSPSFNPISASPDRQQPFREFAIHYHELREPTQAFNAFIGKPTCKDPSSKTDYPITGTDPALVAEAQALRNDNNISMAGVLAPGSDLFAINYGTGGIAAEILANRYKVGPETDCVDCKFEEFFLTSWAVGDPASVSDVLASQELVQKCQGLPVTPPTKVLFPDDPSNVYHSYLNDHVKFRVLHAGADLTHVHHQHAQQWLHSPNDNDSTYLDSQMISPGSAYTLEIDYGGSGNRNRTIGDSIFHCHFYPHFAAGMWGMWRVHDVFEAGTELDNGVAVLNARAQPDGEIVRGTPIPAIVPVPTNAMPPLPAYAHLDATGRIVQYGGICNGNNVDGMPLTSGTCTNGQTVFGTAQLDGQFTMAANQSSPGNSGYPFFIPGIAGSRPPHPPLDFACELDINDKCKLTNGKPNLYDGGLPRHVIATGTVLREHHNVWDFTKDNDTLNARELPEDGTPAEKAAIAYNGTCHHSSFTPLGVVADFRTNGLPNGPQHGAPFADPAVHEDCTAAGTRVVRYKAANVQTDVVFSKKGWHYPQQRFITLWDDVAPTLAGGTLAQPFFFRANSKQDVIEYWLANLVPTYYALDNFQVRTPTDILGQHIHLVKFDVLASDGAANGFNYEDGTLSYQEVTERIHAINRDGGIHLYQSNARRDLTPKSIPELDPTNRFPGAQATVQRWYPDPLMGSEGDPTTDRTIRTVFTHDHFGPSTHQQAGLYAGLLVEPEGSTWTTQKGTLMKTRADGGPTSWDARILHGTQSYREFALEFQDLALAYTSASITQPVCYPTDAPKNPPPPPFSTPARPSPDLAGCTAYGPYPIIAASTPPFGWADAIAQHAINPATANPTFLTNPTIISGSVFTGTLTVNYRNEPLALRVNNYIDGKRPSHDPTDHKTDLAYAFASIERADPDLNEQPPAGCPINPPATNLKFNAPFPGAGDFDPYTPLLRAYQGDPIQVRVLVGGYLYNHNFAFHGVHWLFEPSALDSGWRDNQGMGISEHFEFLFKAPVTKKVTTIEPCLKGADPKIFCADYLYTPGAGQWDLAQGLWGIMRTYNLGGASPIADLAPLPNNTGGGNGMAAAGCPDGAPQRNYNVKAIADSPLTFNDRLGTGNKIINPTPLRYVLTDEAFEPLSPLTTDRKPLVLRANAGDCVNVTLFNGFDPKDANNSKAHTVFTLRDQNIPGFTPMWKDPDTGQFSTSGFYPSTMVGMHPQLLSYDVTSDQGMNVGLNPVQTVAPAGKRTYHWYAGNVDGSTHTPIEFGSSTIIDADTIEQPSLSMVGAFVTEPQGSSWPTKGELEGDVILNGQTLFREFVNVLQNNAYLYPINAFAPPNTATFFNAINYTSNSMGYRFKGQQGPNPPLTTVITDAFSYTHSRPSSNTEWGDPLTVWVAEKGKPVRLRMVHPDGLGGFPDDVIKLHGHVWSEEPYTAGSTVLGGNTAANWTGGRDGFGPGNHFDILLPSAGGSMAVPGDYLLASFPAAEQANGNWGLLRVCDPGPTGSFPCTRPPVPTTDLLPSTPPKQTVHPPIYGPPPSTGNERFMLRTPAVLHAAPAPPVPVPANNPQGASPPPS